MTFSLIFPTRNRIRKLTNCLNSIYKKTSDKKNTEVLIAYDDDDEVTKAVVEPLCKDFKDINLRMFMYPREINKHKYYNYLLKHSTGENIITLNDDTEFLTDKWDIIARDKIKAFLTKYPDGIYYGYIEDLLENASTRHGTYCCFPLISRKVTELLGFIQDESFLGGGADIHMGNLMHEIQRTIDMKNIVIDHISFHNYKDMPSDRTYDEAWEGYRKNALESPKPTTQTSIERDILLKYINEYKRDHQG